jgi:hypothetical protein
METLRGPDGSYVLQSYTVSYVPSSTEIYYLRTLRRPVEPQMAFLGIGAVPCDLEPKGTAPCQRIMRAVSRGIYDLSGAHNTLLTPRDFAEMLRVPISWVYERTRRHGTARLPRIKIGKYLSFRKEDVLGWLDEYRV